MVVSQIVPGDHTMPRDYLIFWNASSDRMYMNMVEFILFKREFGCKTTNGGYKLPDYPTQK